MQLPEKLRQANKIFRVVTLEGRGRGRPRVGFSPGLQVVNVHDAHARRLACSVSVGFDWSYNHGETEMSAKSPDFMPNHS